MIHINIGPVKWEGSYPDIAIKQGWNEIEKKFWIQVTDRRKGITIRAYMDEEYYNNFHNMGRYIFKQHSIKDPDTEFVDDGEVNPKSFGGGEFREPLGKNLTLDDTEFEIKDDPRWDDPALEK